MEFVFELLLAGFGGGVMGAYMGALPAFIMAGVVALAGGAAALAGGADLTTGWIAFGAMFGPHVGFSSGVVATAFAYNRKKIDDGGAITLALNGIADPVVLLVGGITGVVGMVLFQVLSGLNFPADIPGFIVIIFGIFARLVFGKTGLFGKYDGKKNRTYLSTGGAGGNNFIIALGLGILVSMIGSAMISAGISKDLVASAYPAFIFGIAATTLIFAHVGGAVPGVHHMMFPAAVAFVSSGFNPLFGILFAVVGGLLGDFAGKLVNSYCDTHIDPPAIAIVTLTLLANLIW